MYGHIAKADEYLYRERGLHIAELRNPKGFEYLMLEVPMQKQTAIGRRIAMVQSLCGYAGQVSNRAGVPANSRPTSSAKN